MNSSAHLTDLAPAHSEPPRVAVCPRWAALLLMASVSACSAGGGDDVHSVQASTLMPSEDTPPATTMAAEELAQAPEMPLEPAEPEDVPGDEAEGDPVGPAAQLPEWFVIDSSAIGEGVGVAFSAKLPETFLAMSSDSEHPTRSTLVLEEDGEQLGPSNAIHQTIRETGEGAFSHWGSRLIFSTSDNSDPRTNGRVYRVRVE